MVQDKNILKPSNVAILKLIMHLLAEDKSLSHYKLILNLYILFSVIYLLYIMFLYMLLKFYFNSF